MRTEKIKYVEVYDVGPGISSEGIPACGYIKILPNDPRSCKPTIKPGSWRDINFRKHKLALTRLLRELINNPPGLEKDVSTPQP
jgi:hypothetical protein